MLRAIFILQILLALPQTAFGETIHLKDKTQISGTILSFYEDKFVISANDGEKRIIEKDKVREIIFEETTQIPPVPVDSSVEPKPDADFETPLKTFLYWKKSAIKGDLEGMADCFTSIARDDQLSQLKNFSGKQLKKMRKETKKTDFSFSEPLIDNGTAYLSITRKYEGHESKSIIQFQKEGSNWKMIPD